MKLLEKYGRGVCREKKWVIASHLPGSANVTADKESRVDHKETEWKLDPDVFHQIQSHFGVIDTVDLFASRVNFQIEKYIFLKAAPSFSIRPDV